jgi:hypothetical protein
MIKFSVILSLPIKLRPLSFKTYSILLISLKCRMESAGRWMIHLLLKMFIIQLSQVLSKIIMSVVSTVKRTTTVSVTNTLLIQMELVNV